MSTALPERMNGTGNGRSVFTDRIVMCRVPWYVRSMGALRTSATALASCALLFASAQNTGTLRLVVDPGHDFSFIVDKEFRMQQREVKLTEGLHDLSIWAPTRMIVDTAVFVIADRTSDLVVRLPFSPEYVAYRGDLSRFESRKRWTRAAPVLALAGGLIWTGIAYSNYSKADQALDDDLANYTINVDPRSIDRLKDETIPADNEDLKRARNSLYAATAVTALSAGATYYFMRRTAKWEKPIFDDKQKVRFDGLTWMPGTDGGMFLTGLSISLDR